MNNEEIETKNKAIVHKDNSLNRLDLSFIKHIELNEYKKIEDIPLRIKNEMDKEKVYIETMQNQIEKLKQDSIVLINQITTISKQRIFYDDVFKKVRISNNSLDLIDKQIIKSFTK